MSGHPAIFVDRDGTLNVEVNYLSRPEELVLIPGAAKAISRLAQAGFCVIIITNQSAIARGIITETDLEVIHEELCRQLASEGAHVDGIYHCPHHPEAGSPKFRIKCECRKPAPGLLLQAASEHNISLKESIMIGDNITDLQAGWNAGCRSALVLTGYGKETWSNASPEVRNQIGFTGQDISEVVHQLLEEIRA